MSNKDPRESALQTAEELEEDLEAIADSNLPFATDAQAILSEIKDNE
jgi:hypothetical protein